MRKTTTVLKSLKRGLPVKLDGYSLVMEDDAIWIMAEKYQNGELVDNVLLSYDIPINHFIKSCEALSDEDVALLNMNIALNERNYHA